MRLIQEVSDIEDFEIAELLGVIDVAGLRKRVIGYTMHSYLESGGEGAPNYDGKWFLSKSKARNFFLDNYEGLTVAEVSGAHNKILDRLRQGYKAFFTEQKSTLPFLVGCAERTGSQRQAIEFP